MTGRIFPQMDEFSWEQDGAFDWPSYRGRCYCSWSGPNTNYPHDEFLKKPIKEQKDDPARAGRDTAKQKHYPAPNGAKEWTELLHHSANTVQEKSS